MSRWSMAACSTPRPQQSQGHPTPGQFLSHMPFKKEIVKIIRNGGTDEEEVIEVWATVGHERTARGR